jgi:hypothetical protein
MQRLARDRNWQHPGRIDRFDYARRVRSPRDLPHLLKSLERGAQQPDTIVLIDRFSRIFQRVAYADLSVVLEAILPYGKIFHQAHPVRSLHDVLVLPSLQRDRILFGTEPGPNARCQNKHTGSASDAARTENARRVSRVVRGRAADELARRLAELRAELATQQTGVSIGDLLDAANKLGMKNTQGGSLTYQTVRRALMRAKKAHDQT